MALLISRLFSETLVESNPFSALTRTGSTALTCPKLCTKQATGTVKNDNNNNNNNDDDDDDDDDDDGDGDGDGDGDLIIIIIIIIIIMMITVIILKTYSTYGKLNTL